jgi:hypothetical protein
MFCFTKSDSIRLSSNLEKVTEHSMHAITQLIQRVCYRLIDLRWIRHAKRREEVEELGYESIFFKKIKQEKC